MRRLEAKSICITGSAQGLGRAMSLAFAREGAAVAVIDLRAAAARSGALEVNRSGGRAIAVAADLSRRHAARHAIDEAAQALGGVDVLASDDASFVSGETLRVDGGFAIGIVIPGLDVPQRDRVKPAQRRWKRS